MQQNEGLIKEQELSQNEKNNPKQQFVQGYVLQQPWTNRHLAFQKNYPKNIFIPLIEHLGEVGLQHQYETCVGTRESFEGKNVVSLAQIHRVMSQDWFAKSINLPALVSNMSNKILMNSKIKKKLFHMLLVRQLFNIPLADAREFKKLVSRRANEVAQSKLPSDNLFNFPSALIYLLHLFAEGLSGHQRTVQDQNSFSSSEDQFIKRQHPEQQSLENKVKQRDISSKQEYKLCISKIVSFLNSYQGQPAELLDLIQGVKAKIATREIQIRAKYDFWPHVPEWSYFSNLVVGNCYLQKRSKGKLTFSMVNQWIQQFKQKATSLNGFLALKPDENQYSFKPIVLVSPPQ